MILCERRYKKKLVLDEETLETLTPYVELVVRFIAFIRVTSMNIVDSENMAVAMKLENKINKMRRT